MKFLLANGSDQCRARFMSSRKSSSLQSMNQATVRRRVSVLSSALSIKWRADFSRTALAT